MKSAGESLRIFTSELYAKVLVVAGSNLVPIVSVSIGGKGSAVASFGRRLSRALKVAVQSLFLGQ